MELKSGESHVLPLVAVVGAGASGVLAAIRLLESPPAKAGKLRVLLVEKKPAFGRGVAYGTEAEFHLLNVRQNRMSAYPEDSENFSRWIARAYPAAMKEAFQPRHRYAEYLASLLTDAKRGAPGGTLATLTAELERFESRPDGKIELYFRDGSPKTCDRLILAPGHLAPGVPDGLRSVRASARFLGDPWEAAKVAALGKNEQVLVVGSGLTTVDFVLSRMRGGHLAPIDVVSRHGLSPLAHPARHAEFALSTPFKDESVVGVFRELRTAAASAEEAWPDVIDRFRVEIHRVWNAWSERERGRFLRHVRSYWDIHRHRVAPEVHREWDLYRRGGKVRVEAARVLDVAEGAEGFRVRLARRSGGTMEKRYDRIVNCTGSSPDLTLLEGHGYAQDPLQLGVPTDSAGRPFLADGKPDPAIFIIGPALRTRFWEMTAIPDLRGQAKVAVDALLEGLRP